HDLDLDEAATSLTPGDRVAGVDDEAMGPGVEPIRLTEAADTQPRPKQGILDRILGAVIVPNDQPGDGIPAVDGAVDERGECDAVTVAGPEHQVSMVGGQHAFSS